MAYIPSSGSVAAWLQSDTASVITVHQGSVAAVIIGGSVATTNSSVMLLNSTNVIGSVLVLQGTNPLIITGSIQGAGAGTQYLENAITPSVTGTAVMFKSNMSTSIISVVSPATPLPVSVQGVVTALQGTTPWLIGSVYGNVSGSVVAFQGTAPWAVSMGGSVIAVLQSSSIIAVATGSIISVPSGSIISVFQSSSVIAVNAGSVVTLSSGSVITVLQAPSVVGTYSEDAAHTSSDKGLFTLMVRNDTISSITSNDLDYSPHVVDAVGRTIIKPFAGENATIISYVGSIVSGSVQLIQASVIGSRSYITDFWLSNTGAATTLVTFQGGDTSLVGQFIAPTGGGMASPGIAIPLKTTLSQDLAFKVSPSSSVVYVMLKGYQAP